MRTVLEIYKAMDSFYTKAIAQRDRALVDAAPAYHKIVGKRDLVEAIRWLYRNPKWQWQKVR